MGGQNAELIAVFCDGAPGDFDTFGLELCFDGCIREWFVGWFAGNDFLNGFADACV